MDYIIIIVQLIILEMKSMTCWTVQKNRLRQSGSSLEATCDDVKMWTWPVVQTLDGCFFFFPCLVYRVYSSWDFYDVIWWDQYQWPMNMEVSWNGASPKSPKSSILIGFSIINQPIWVWINTYRYIFNGMNIHESQLFWCELQGYKGFDTLPYEWIDVWFIILLALWFKGSKRSRMATRQAGLETLKKWHPKALWCSSFEGWHERQKPET